MCNWYSQIAKWSQVVLLDTRNSRAYRPAPRCSMPRLATVAMCASLLAVPSHSSAQVGGGSIQGTVLDSSNAALPRATVTATNLATGVETTRLTTDAGVYALIALQPGQYRVTVTLDG